MNTEHLDVRIWNGPDHHKMKQLQRNPRCHPFEFDLEWLGCLDLEWNLNTEQFNIQTILDHSNTEGVQYLSPHCLKYSTKAVYIQGYSN